MPVIRPIIPNVMCKSSACPNCAPSQSEFSALPLEFGETLFKCTYEKKHIATHKCISCGKVFVGITCQVYDHLHSYWSCINEQEINKLNQHKNQPECFELSKDIIETKKSHFYQDSGNKYFYKEVSPVVLAGLAPW